ncbi:MAG: family 1 glycosylhydrolase, partial [Pseudomonadota bacterium]
MQNTRATFPEGFQFGAATSSYQIEGQAAGGAGLTHWDTFAATPSNVVGGEDGADKRVGKGGTDRRVIVARLPGHWRASVTRA